MTFRDCFVLDLKSTEWKMAEESALFMHVAQENYIPTEGCIVLVRCDMKRLLYPI
ncbi:hypothetical protein MCQ_00718 [Candidatus Bartonella washoeensis Sb944nv]|uniref:Uncharacterized protein n=1 Tax=Candidatus Bartonella washoeensis Sb944nv TaxID=1094563 RepID=J1J4U1_9HYPH|nr:hypothetical protein [Bartonella washoeensis]EJF79177.1 hypothetical protein MCQ_00718 [Bartonella washoeensis Sb944nv]